MPALSGSEKALHYAQFGVMRFGASRFGYHSAHAFVTIAGTHVAYGRASTAYKLESASLTITDALDETPNTCAFTISGFTPTVGQEVIIALGSKNNSDRLFAGHILTVTQLQATAVATVHYAVTAIDYTWLLQGRKVVKRYTNQSATAIITDLMTSFAPSGFTTTKVASGLATLNEFTVSGDEDLPGAISRVMKRIGGYWYVDYHKDVHAFTGTESGITHPVNLTTSHASMQDFQHRRDNSQVVTRVVVEGGGANAAAARAVGNTTLPIDSAAWYATGGGSVVCGPQRLTYTGKQAGGTGSTTVGVNQSPSAPAADAAASASISGITRSSNTATATTSSAHNLQTGVYVVIKGATQVDYNGSFRVTVTGSTTFTYDVSDTPVTPATGTITYVAVGHVEPGTHNYFVAFVNNDGHSEKSVADAATVTAVTAPTMTSFTATGAAGGSIEDDSNGYYYGCSFLTPLGETAVTRLNAGWNLTAGQTAWSLSNIPTSTDARVTGRKIYRTKKDASVSAEMYLVTTIADNTTTTYTDRTSNDALSVAAPTGNSTGGAVVVTSIPIGPAGTTARRLYRTEAGGTTAKALTTIGDNTTTSYMDVKADTALGDEAPSASTIPTPVGNTTLQVNDLAQFPASGWVQSDSQVIHYTGRSAASGVGTLTGIPASGTGAIVAAIGAGSAVVVQPHLTGIPASGTGSILYAINQGDPVNILVTRNNTSAQTALAALIGGNGIVEEYVTDNRLSITECAARGDAILDLRAAAEASITYRSRDKNTRAGRTITVSLAAPTSVSASFKIQTVTISGFSHSASLFPTFTASASSTRFSFEDLLRLARKGGEAA